MSSAKSWRLHSSWCDAEPGLTLGSEGLCVLLWSGWTSALSQTDGVAAMGNVCSVPPALKTENIPNSQIRDTQWVVSIKRGHKNLQ